MTLLNGLLAFGAAAFTIPLIIHLLHRSRYQTVDWGAMHLLQSSRNLNSRRLQWQQILLLLLRCALPVLLAMAMARPLLQSFLSADGQSALSIAIILDDSMSMFAADQKQGNGLNPTHFSVACQSAMDILKELPSASNAMVLLGGSTPEALFGQVPDDLVLKLKEVGERSFPAGEFGLEESVRLSLQWLASSPHHRRQLVVISDFQKHEWSSLMESKISDMTERIANQTVRPQLSFVRVGSASESHASSPQSNLSVESIDVSPSLIALNRDSFISTTIGNHGTAKCDSVHVAVFINDIEIERQEISIAEASTAVIRSHWSSKLAGDHVIRVQILRDDDLIADNSLSTAVVVQEPIPILLVDGDRRSDAMQSETDFLRLALSPFSLLTGEKGDVFNSKTIQQHELSESLLSKYRTVCLCNVREVTDVQQTWLHDYVERGNGLIVFLGDKVRTEHYQAWPTLANHGLRIANFQTRTKVQTNSADNSERKSSLGEDILGAGDRVKMQQIEFAPIRELSPASLASLASVRFEHRTPITLDPVSLTNASDASVAVRFEDDEAWILEARIGKGRCLWISTACDDDDSNLPTRSIYVPLIQKLAAFACNAIPPETSLRAGDVWTRPIPELALKANEEIKEVRVTKPDGKVVNVQLADDRIFRFGETRLLGTYITRLVESQQNVSLKVDEQGSNPDSMVACVNSKNFLSGRESQLSYLSSEELAKLANSFNATVSASSRELLDLSHTDWHGREIWTWVWTALVICFLAEMAIEQSLSPRLKTRAGSAIPHVAQGTVT